MFVIWEYPIAIMMQLCISSFSVHIHPNFQMLNFLIWKNIWNQMQFYPKTIIREQASFLIRMRVILRKIQLVKMWKEKRDIYFQKYMIGWNRIR